MVKRKNPLVRVLKRTEAGGRASSHVWRENHESEEGNESERCHDGATTFPHPTSGLFLLIATQPFSSPSDNIPCSPSGHEVEVHYELRPHN